MEGVPVHYKETQGRNKYPRPTPILTLITPKGYSYLLHEWYIGVPSVFAGANIRFLIEMSLLDMVWRPHRGYGACDFRLIMVNVEGSRAEAWHLAPSHLSDAWNTGAKVQIMTLMRLIST